MTNPHAPRTPAAKRRPPRPEPGPYVPHPNQATARWRDELTGHPAQSWTYTLHDGLLNFLYLRMTRSSPHYWQGYIVKHTLPNGNGHRPSYLTLLTSADATWSGNLLSPHALIRDQLPQARRCLINTWLTMHHIPSNRIIRFNQPNS